MAFPGIKRLLVGTLAGLLLASTASISAGLADEGTAKHERLIDRFPFDRITLDPANEGAQVDVQLLDFPGRQVPDLFPEEGSLEIRRLSDPTTLYQVNWSAIERIELYESLVLQEAQQHIAAGKLVEAFANLDYLHRNYPQLSGLGPVIEQYLQRDALTAFSAGRYDEALAILASLYSVNPQRRGLGQAIEGVSDRLISDKLQNQEFAAARKILESLRQGFPQLSLNNLALWQKRFTTGAEKQLAVAHEAMDRGDFATARRAVRQAISILPETAGALELLQEVDRRSPEIVVGVSQLALSVDRAITNDWSVDRVSRLVSPKLVEIVDLGTEGGEYAGPWGTIRTNEAGLELELTLHDTALAAGITPERFALEVVRLADRKLPNYQADFSAVFREVEIVGGRSVVIRLRHPHVRPIAFLQIPLARICGSTPVPGSYTTVQNSDQPLSVLFNLTETSPRGPKVVIEQTYENEEAAIAALRRGDLDVLEELPPWQIEQVEKIPGVTVGTYRAPVVHLLLANYDNPLLRQREFRRALCYGIDRERLVREFLAGENELPGMRVISGPFPVGVSFGDTIGYAYKQDLQPLPYEPRLAAVLNITARATISKQVPPSDNKKKPPSESTTELPPKPKPLILVHPGDAVAESMCQLIKRQLEAIGVPIEPRELSAREISSPIKWDLRYIEICLKEPVVEARQLLGPGGLAGRCSSVMELALRDLDQAVSWNAVQTQLQRIHQIAFDDLPVIPLWQTQKFFAYQQRLSGIGKSPLSLYQNISQWGKNYRSEGN